MKFVGAVLILAALTAPLAAQAQAPSAPAKASAPVPLAAFAQFPDLQSPRISPGGKVIAAKVRSGGKQALAIVPLDGAGKPQIISRDGEFDRQGDRVIRSWRWVDDENLVLTLTTRANFLGDWFDSGRLVAYNRKTGKLMPLGWLGSNYDASDILWVSREGPPQLLLARGPDPDDPARFGLPEGIKVDVLTGRQQVVERPARGVSGWYADANGVVRMGTSYDRQTGKVTVKYRPQAGATLRTIIDETPDRFGVLPVPAVFLKEPGKALAMSRKDGHTALYELDLATMKLGAPVFKVPGYDIGDVTATPSGDALEMVAYTDTKDRQMFFDPRLKEIKAGLEETFGRGNVALASADRAREMIVARVAKSGQPGAFYVYDTRSGDVRRLGYINSAIGDAQLNPVSTIRYQASDGKTIQAVLTMPRHRAGQAKLPLIVLPHGGPWARDSEDWEYVPWAQPLAELGYVVIQPNFRGSSGYGRDWEAASDGNWGNRMQDDLNDAIAHLARQGTVDAGRVCMMGWSYGGYAASRAAQRDGDKYRCTISGAGVHDLPDMVAYDRDYLGPYGAKTALGAAGKLVDVSPARHAAKFSAPILIIHGEKDVRVPVAQSRGLVSRLRSAGKVEGRDFVYVELPRETHNLLLESSRQRVLNEVKAFLDKHNPA